MRACHSISHQAEVANIYGEPASSAHRATCFYRCYYSTTVNCGLIPKCGAGGAPSAVESAGALRRPVGVGTAASASHFSTALATGNPLVVGRCRRSSLGPWLGPASSTDLFTGESPDGASNVRVPPLGWVASLGVLLSLRLPSPGTYAEVKTPPPEAATPPAKGRSPMARQDRLPRPVGDLWVWVTPYPGVRRLPAVAQWGPGLRLGRPLAKVLGTSGEETPYPGCLRRTPFAVAQWAQASGSTSAERLPRPQP